MASITSHILMILVSLCLSMVSPQMLNLYVQLPADISHLNVSQTPQNKYVQNETYHTPWPFLLYIHYGLPSYKTQNPQKNPRPLLLFHSINHDFSLSRLLKYWLIDLPDSKIVLLKYILYFATKMMYKNANLGYHVTTGIVLTICSLN